MEPRKFIRDLRNTPVPLVFIDSFIEWFECPLCAKSHPRQFSKFLNLRSHLLLKVQNLYVEEKLESYAD